MNQKILKRLEALEQNNKVKASLRKSIYEYLDYVLYLEKAILEKSKEVKGVKLKLAKFISCHPSYLSQVLAKKVNFNLEQGVKINSFFNHSKSESRYFLWLIEYARSGSIELKKFFKEQITELQKERLDLKNRIQDTETIKLEHQHKYYSAWFYSAIYVSLSIPDVKRPTDVANILSLPIRVVHEGIEFLVQSGLVTEESGSYNLTQKNLHLSRNNDFIKRHHINWRSKSLQSVELNLEENLHYSSVLAIHSDDFIRLKEHFIQAIADSKSIIAPSPVT